GGGADAGGTGDIIRPMALPPRRHQEVGGDRIPSPRRRLSHTLGERRYHSHHDRRMRTLQGFCNEPLPDSGHEVAFNRYVPKSAREPIRRVALPNRQHLIYRLAKHRVAIALEIAL